MPPATQQTSRLPLILLAAVALAVSPSPTAAAGSGAIGSYATNNEQRDSRVVGCLLALPAGADPNSVQACAELCRSRAPACVAFAFNEDDTDGGACEHSTGRPGTGACALTSAAGWVAFTMDNFQPPSPAVGACQGSISQCQNSGVCLSRTEQTGGSYVCACPVGFTGTQCQTPVPQPSWSSWSDFSACSATCGLGVRRRSRSCLNSGGQAMATVAVCGSDGAENYETCNNTVCPTWSSWSSWSVCNTSTSCGPGVRQRSRSCLSGGVIGADCRGSALESTPCDSVSCSIQAAPLSLNPVIAEPMTVGKGYVQIYSDTYNTVGFVCSDGFENDREGTVVCRTLGFDGVQSLPAVSSLPAMPSPATYFLTNLECTGTEQSLQSCQHSAWSNATACASGRAAYVLCKVNGRWSPWDSWESCDGKCGGATRNRNRTCTSPRPLGGLNCDGVGFQETLCPGLSPCPVDGTWSQWSAWESCTAVCGGGSQTRRRSCTEPQYGGADCPGDSKETTACNTDPCPVDGFYENWSDWGTCSATCGGGAQVRTRICIPPANSGKPCQGPASESQSCANQSCPVDGGWSAWSAWGSCNATCGGAKAGRARACNNPAPAHGGAPCVGGDFETQDCNMFNCPVDGQLTSWSNYSTCSATCGGGNKTRQRACVGPFYGGAPCVGPLQETLACNAQPCPVDGQWSAWGSWSACNVTCGGGLQLRSRLCSNPAPAYGGQGCSGSGTEATACATASCPVNGYYKDWSAWSACTRTCGGGTYTRTRECVPPQFGGLACSGSASETQPCMTQQCPIDGAWYPWSVWGGCNGTCGAAVRTRTRNCQQPQFGGSPCIGEATEALACDTQPCPVNGYYTEWAAWSVCTRSCAGGTYTRTRACVPPQFGGLVTCSSDDSQTQMCMTQQCPIDGAWYPWSVWGGCNGTCGAAVRTRTRNCQQPQFGGSPCVGEATEALACDTQPCPVNCQLSSWSNWTACPVACSGAGATRSRTRSVAVSATLGGLDCTGATSETEVCDCGLPGQWGDWGAWSQCSRTCDSGLRSRGRACASRNASRPMLPCPGNATEAAACHEFPCVPRQATCANWVRLGLQVSTMVDIKPAGLETRAFCNVTENSTTLGHSLQGNETLVHGFELPGSYVISIDYDGGLATGAALAAGARRCAQFMRLRCRNSLRTRRAWAGEVMTWWNNRNGDMMTSWGSVPGNQTVCSCGVAKTCSLPDYLCNCDGPSADWAEDSGYAMDAAELPVHSVQVGDTGNPNENVGILIGPLICWH